MSDPTRDEAVSFQAARAGTLDGLRAAIIARMGVVADKFQFLQTKKGEDRSPEVVDGWLDFLVDNDVERFPFIIVRPTNGKDSPQGAEQDATAIVKLIVGTYSDTKDGFRDAVQVLDAIREDLASAPTIDGTAYEHTGPLEWEVSEEQHRPQWMAVAITNWTLPRPRRVEALNPDSEAKE
jgi:hypothetical protein